MEKGKKNRKQVIIGISVLLLVTLLLLGLTYAYYRTRIIGNTNSESVSVTSENLSVTYQDGVSTLETESVEPGSKFTKSFSVENTGDAKASYSIILDQKENGFKRSEDWSYKLYEGTEVNENPIAQGTIAVGSEQIIYGKAEVEKDGIDNYVLEIEYVNLSNVDQSIDMGTTLSFRVNIGEEKVTWDNAPQGTLLNAIKTNTQGMATEPETTPGEKVSKETEKVFAATEDDYGIAHYFRGAVDNNYITIGTSCWRIVRIQGDGSIKIILYDEQHPCNDSVHSDVGYITEGGKGSEGYPGYITTNYSGPVDIASVRFDTSAAKQELDKWYEAVFTGSGRLSAYSNNVEQNAEWCNDLSEVETISGTTYFGAYKRLSSENGNIPTGPSLKCKSLNDDHDESIYTGSIAMLNADELIYAGYIYGGSPDSSGYVYLTDHGFDRSEYTMTPAFSGPIQNLYDSGKALLGMDAAQYMKTFGLPGGSYGLRPMITLRPDVKVSGSGTKETPYELSTK